MLKHPRRGQSEKEIDLESLPNTKRCSKCREWKPLTDFAANRSKRDGLQADCRICKKSAFKAWYESHRQRVLDRVDAYRREHPEQAAQRSRKHRATHPRPARTPRDRERGRANTRKWQARQHEVGPYRERVRAARRRARKVNATGAYRLAEWQALCASYGNRCLCCGATGKLSADHVIPLSRGGTNDIGNIQPLCQSCNSSKGTKTIDYRT